MKRILTTILVLLLAKSYAFSQNESVIKISNEKEFRQIAEATLEGYSFYKKRIVLTQDVVLQGDTILPIGIYPTEYSTAIPFQGEFDGNGHTITIKAPLAVYITSEVDKYRITHRLALSGLFGYIGNAGVVKNLNVVIKDIITDISYTYVHTGLFGIVAGFNAGVILNCHTEGKYSLTVNYNDYINYGSIVGILNAEGSVCNCSNYANITTNYISRVGGIVGRSEGGIIFKSHNIGDIIVENGVSHGGDGRCVGGIVGENRGVGDDLSPYVINCINHGRIVTKDDVLSAGGIVGKSMDNGLIFYCGNTGDIYSDAEYVGGVVGRLIYSSVFGSYQAGCMYSHNARKTKNVAVGIRWWKNEPTDETYVMSNCGGIISAEMFMRKANRFYPEAESILADYLKVDKKGYSTFFQPEPWTLSAGQSLPYFKQ